MTPSALFGLSAEALASARIHFASSMLASCAPSGRSPSRSVMGSGAGGGALAAEVATSKSAFSASGERLVLATRCSG